MKSKNYQQQEALTSQSHVSIFDFIFTQYIKNHNAS